MKIVILLFMILSGCGSVKVVKPVDLHEIKRVVENEKQKKEIKANEYYQDGLRYKKEGHTVRASMAFKRAITFNPGHIPAKQSLNELKGEIESGIKVKSDKKVSVNLPEMLIPEVMDIINDITGVKFIVNSELKDVRISLKFEDASVEDVLFFLQKSRGIESEIVKPDLVYIGGQGPQSMTLLKVIYLTFIKPDDAKSIIDAVCKPEMIVIDSINNSIIVKGSKESIDQIKKVISLIDVNQPEVMLEIEVVEMAEDHLKNLGLNLSLDQVSMGYPGQDLTFRQIFDMPLAVAAVPQAIFNIQKQEAGSRTIASPKLRVINKNKGLIHIGDKIPSVGSILMSTGTAVSKIDYIDVGVKLEFEPVIHNDGHVTVKMIIEVSSIGNPVKDKDGAIITYQVGTRRTETILQLQDGETQIIGGMIRDDERNSKKDIPGFASIPLIGSLFGSRSTGSLKSEVVLSITPHVINEFNPPEFDEIKQVISRPELAASSGMIRPTVKHIKGRKQVNE